LKAWIRIYCLLAGLCDAATGILLLAAPRFVFSLLGLEPLPSPPIYASFVGVFVLAVGLAYLYPWVISAAGRRERIRVVFEVTALSRLAVALFLGFAILDRALGLLWGIVLLTDFSLAGFQLFLLRRWSSVGEGRQT